MIIGFSFMHLEKKAEYKNIIKIYYLPIDKNIFMDDFQWWNKTANVMPAQRWAPARIKAMETSAHVQLIEWPASSIKSSSPAAREVLARARSQSTWHVLYS
jgi:hypothetical protein